MAWARIQTELGRGQNKIESLPLNVFCFVYHCQILSCFPCGEKGLEIPFQTSPWTHPKVLRRQGSNLASTIDLPYLSIHMCVCRCYVSPSSRQLALILLLKAIWYMEGLALLPFMEQPQPSEPVSLAESVYMEVFVYYSRGIPHRNSYLRNNSQCIPIPVLLHQSPHFFCKRKLTMWHLNPRGWPLQNRPMSTPPFCVCS